MTFSRQSMFEPAASISVLRLSMTISTCRSNESSGNVGVGDPLARASRKFFAELGVERRQPGNVDHVSVADAEVIMRAGIERGNVDDSFFHDAGRAGES